MSNNKGLQGRNENRLESSEASKWVLDILWYQGQDKYVKLRVLDSIRVEDGVISSWLFTSVSEELIKSRSRGRWTTGALVDKCGPVEATDKGVESMKAHYTVTTAEENEGKMSWKVVDNQDTVKETITKSPKDYAMVCFSGIEGAISFAEISFSLEKDVYGKPKIVTHTLYSGSKLNPDKNDYAANRTKEKGPVDALPQQKQICLNKQVCNEALNFINSLRRIIESRGKCKIIKFVVVALLEASPDNNSKIVWLHHIKELVLDGGKSSDNNNGEDEFDANDNDWMRQERIERRSNAPSETSVVSINGSKIIKCVGDFCHCPLDEEGLKSALDSHYDADGSVLSEIRKARARHHKDDSPSKPKTDVSAEIGKSKFKSKI